MNNEQKPVAYIRQKDIERLLSPHVAGCAANLEKEPRDGFVPFYTHEDACGEVERLRRHKHDADVALAAATRLYKKHEVTITELRAQLAGLRKAAGAVMDGFIEGAQVHPCDDQNEAVKVSTLSPVFQALYAALSASADSDGEFVYYEDHETVVNDLHKRIRELESKVVQLNDILEFDLDDMK